MTTSETPSFTERTLGSCHEPAGGPGFQPLPSARASDSARPAWCFTRFHRVRLESSGQSLEWDGRSAVVSRARGGAAFCFRKSTA